VLRRSSAAIARAKATTLKTLTKAIASSEAMVLGAFVYCSLGSAIDKDPATLRSIRSRSRKAGTVGQ
jgi:hypothetical protein